MSRAEEYLAIPEAYCRWMGGLRWCPSGEAVEYASADPEIGCTFAMGGEIGLFLEGFAAVRSPLAFGLVLHLLHLLGQGLRSPGIVPARRAERLAEAFRASGRRLRNAGALCGSLCLDVPGAANPPPLGEVGLALARPHAGPFGLRRLAAEAEVPPLEPPAFEARVLDALDQLSPDDLRHWLRHGRGPVVGVGERIARQVPRPLSARLAALERRPRLAEMGPLVAHLSGALSLPPRRLAPSDLPTGGYADVATRGLPEAILPGQLALDADEFVRRFAEHELLYFLREEPRRPASEELLVVLDQGVRTWGDVRLVLAAAAVALGRGAGRRKIPFLVAATSNEGRVVDAREVDEEALGALFEASDLTPHPGDALGRVLERPSGRAVRDVVLLTHPRSLATPEVSAVARHVPDGTRLFAVSADGTGRVEVAELRHGSPVVRSALRVASPEAVSRASARPTAPAEASSWRGDVESPGFPFTLGALSPIRGHQFDFDHSGEWILLAGQHGLLHCWRSDGTRGEMLPRALAEGRPVVQVDVIVGVGGGFVVIGGTGTSLVAAHYDLAARVCRSYPLPSFFPECVYVPRLNSVVMRTSLAIDLDAGPDSAFYPPRSPSAPTSPRAKLAFLAAGEGLPPDRMVVSGSDPLPARGRALRLHPETGAVDIQDDLGSLRRTIVPESDGRPALKGCRILETRSGGDVLAALVADPAKVSLYLFGVSSDLCLGLPHELHGPWPRHAREGGIALSSDGRRFARRAGDRQLEIREVSGRPVPLFVTPKGKSHGRVEVELGESFLTIDTGRFVHLARWDRGRLELAMSQESLASLLTRQFAGTTPRVLTAKAGRRREGAVGDPRRFLASVTFAGRTVTVDFIGQVAVFGSSLELVTMIYAFRDKVAAWMPDGTRLGPESLIGGRATPGAAERIGAALRAASSARSPDR